MQTYTCPTCGEKMERDLTLFIEHTDAHIVDELKKQHPSWITDDGFCAKCLEHYKAAKLGLVSANIDEAGVRRRLVLGVAGFGMAAAALYWLKAAGAPPMARLVVFPLFFLGLLGFFQAQKRFCVVIAQKQADPMRKRARKILIVAAMMALLLTVAAGMGW